MKNKVNRKGKLLGAYVPKGVHEGAQRWARDGRERTMSHFLREAAREKLEREGIHVAQGFVTLSTLLVVVAVCGVAAALWIFRSAELLTVALGSAGWCWHRLRAADHRFESALPRWAQFLCLLAVLVGGVLAVIRFAKF